MLNRLFACVFFLCCMCVEPLSSVRAQEQSDWFPFNPASDPLDDSSPIDLRYLNEAFAGENGHILAKDGQFVHEATGKPVRFWAVNGPPDNLSGQELKRFARWLAKYGVNLIRFHRPLFDEQGNADMARITYLQEVVDAMKHEGIYTHVSFYFPLWFKPGAKTPWLEGYDGTKHPFAALFFHEGFQQKHREWMRQFLTQPGTNGKKLIDEPAVFGIELQNEDSLFFWTFGEQNLPEPQLKTLETRFGEWLIKRDGSLSKTMTRWGNAPLPRDNVTEMRVAFRPLWNLFNDRSIRDQDTVRFLYETQASFYQGATDSLRQLGFKGLVHASNWVTASPERLTPLEKMSYLSGDFIDRHGYFECNHKGENAAWSIRPEHTFSHRSSLRFDGEEPGKPKLFSNPVMDPHYNDKPSMISETTFTRPNRYRTEAPLYFASYGALQDTDAIVHFAFDGKTWGVKPNFWMQQWTLVSPAMLGQFPAAALIYRKSLVKSGDLVAEVNLNRNDLLELKGTPLPQGANLDELRRKDLPDNQQLEPDQVIDPLIHFVGRTKVTFSDFPTKVSLSPKSASIDQGLQYVTSSTGELRLDYGSGILQIRAPQVEAIVGPINGQKAIQLPSFHVKGEMDLAAIALVALDDLPISQSKRMLLQVMTEEQPSGFEAEQIGNNQYRIKQIGTDPWVVRKVNATIEFHRAKATALRVTALDGNGYRAKELGPRESFRLLDDVIYYLVETN